VGGYPAAAKHTLAEERADAEATLRAAVADELGDRATHAALRISEGLAGRVIVETARETHVQPVVLVGAGCQLALPRPACLTASSTRPCSASCQ
jgi:hypothetical protein